jgi:hypothetical protein
MGSLRLYVGHSTCLYFDVQCTCFLAWRDYQFLGCLEVLFVASSALRSLLPQAEADLYAKSSQLVQFLHSWKGSAPNIPGRFEELMIELYERSYVEVQVRYCN